VCAQAQENGFSVRRGMAAKAVVRGCISATDAYAAFTTAM